MPTLTQQLDAALQRFSGKDVYCIIDSTQASQQIPRWRDAVYKDGWEFYILGYPEEIATHAHVLPWIAKMRPYGELHKIIMDQSGNSMNILLCGEPDMTRIAMGLLPLRHAVLPDGNTVWFRFYDPRVFTTFFAVATEEQKDMFFKNSVYTYFSEDILSESIKQYSRQEKVISKFISNKIQISSQQKEELDQAHFNNILYCIFKDINKYEHYMGKKYAELYEHILMVAEWAYAHGVTDAQELHLLVRMLLKMPWNEEIADALAQKTARCTRSDSVGRRKYILAQRVIMGRQE